MKLVSLIYRQSQLLLGRWRGGVKGEFGVRLGTGDILVVEEEKCSLAPGGGGSLVPQVEEDEA